MVETPDCRTPAFHQAGQAEALATAPLLRSLPYGSLPVRSTVSENAIPRTSEAVDASTRLVKSALSRRKVAYVRFVNPSCPNSLVQALEWSAEMIPHYCAYRRVHNQVQTFRGRFQAAIYRLAIEQVAEL